MKVFIATDINIVIDNDKILANGKYSTILRRYYNAFGPIVLCARRSVNDGNSKGLNDISDIVESIVEISSLFSVFLNRCNVIIKDAMKNCDLVVGRCPSIVAYKASDIAKRFQKPFFAESMGCAWDAYWNHGIIGKLIAPYMFFKMKSVVKNADYALYVTNEFLQNRYPCKKESIGASNVLIESVDENVLQRRLNKIVNSDFKNITLMTTAAVDVKYKGQEFVIKAISKLNKLDIRVKYLLIGEGDSSYLKKVAKNCGVEEQVVFLGRKPLNEVFELLDEADIYIQPSLQEGLPRSMIEAMSRGCPCIGTRTAGIPELISSDCIVKRKSVQEIVEAINRIDNVNKMTMLTKQNFENAKKYQDSVLSKKRNEYYAKIRLFISRGE